MLKRVEQESASRSNLEEILGVKEKELSEANEDFARLKCTVEDYKIAWNNDEKVRLLEALQISIKLFSTDVEIRNATNSVNISNENITLTDLNKSSGFCKVYDYEKRIHCTFNLADLLIVLEGTSGWLFCLIFFNLLIKS